jgi:D-threo-aldose 1-dehydrogenase
MLDRPIKTPVLGFGCGSLTGTSRRGANRVLAAAFDAGIRHFDVARYYGFGEAEGILGRFLNGRRSEVTITTKFGIEPPRRTAAFDLALGIGRQVVRLLPAARKVLQRGAQSLVKSNAFSVQQAQISLETSLRELRTDHIDVFLLHDYLADNQNLHELLSFLEDKVKLGQIGAFGIGTSFEAVLQTIEQQPRLCRVLQFQSSVLTRNIERLPEKASPRLVITHGSLGESYRTILKFLETRSDLAQDWAARIGCERLDEDTLSSLMLNYGANWNREGLVVFSSRDPARVRKNAKAVMDSKFSCSQIAAFRDLVERESSVIVAGCARTTSSS